MLNNGFCLFKNFFFPNWLNKLEICSHILYFMLWDNPFLIFCVRVSVLVLVNKWKQSQFPGLVWLGIWQLPFLRNLIHVTLGTIYTVWTFLLFLSTGGTSTGAPVCLFVLAKKIEKKVWWLLFTLRYFLRQGRTGSYHLWAWING